jgi:hypothetical protein
MGGKGEGLNLKEIDKPKSKGDKKKDARNTPGNEAAVSVHLSGSTKQNG